MITFDQWRTGVYNGTTNPYAVGTSEWWIWRLQRRLEAQATEMERLNGYFEGTNDTFRLASAAAQASGIATLFRGLNANLAELIVGAVLQRLEVYGFRTAEGDVDAEAWRIWQANEMDRVAPMAHTEALAKGYCPVLIEPSADPRTPTITPQDPLGFVAEQAPGDPRQVRAAMKQWVEDDGRMLITLYLPDRIERWQASRPSTGLGGAVTGMVQGLMGAVPRQYQPRQLGRGEEWSELNPLGRVPVAILTNHARLRGTCFAEHEKVLPLLDLFNKTILDMATTSEFAAFPQRYGIGVELDEGEQPETAEGLLIAEAEVAQGPLARFRAAVDSMITTPSPDAQFGQFPAADLRGYGDMLERVVTAIGTITFTPYHLLLNMPTAVPATGEALKAAEAGLVAKVEEHQREKGGGWEAALDIAFELAELTERPALEAVWKPAATISEAQHVDALTKLATSLKLPIRGLWEMLPASPQQIARWERMLLEQAAAATGPEPGAGEPAVQGAPAAPPAPSQAA